MIEFQNPNIAFSAIHARVFLKVRDQLIAPHVSNPPLAFIPAQVILHFIVSIVLATILTLTFVTIAALRSTDFLMLRREFFERFHEFAESALLHA